MKILINVVNAKNVVDQNTRPDSEVAILIRRIPCVGELINQFLTISDAVFSTSGILSDDEDILIINDR